MNTTTIKSKIITKLHKNRFNNVPSNEQIEDAQIIADVKVPDVEAKKASRAYWKKTLKIACRIAIVFAVLCAGFYFLSKVVNETVLMAIMFLILFVIIRFIIQVVLKIVSFVFTIITILVVFIFVLCIILALI